MSKKKADAPKTQEPKLEQAVIRNTSPVKEIDNSARVSRTEVVKLWRKEGDEWVQVRPIYKINTEAFLEKMKVEDPSNEYKVE